MYVYIYIYIYVRVKSVPSVLYGQQVDILISKNQALQVLYLKHCVYNETT